VPENKRPGPRVLLTGGKGFVGGRLTHKLGQTHPNWIIDAPGGPSDPGGRALDVTDSHAVDAWLDTHQPNIIVHLAALSAVTASVRDPRLAWRVNLDGVLNVVLGMQRTVPDAHLLFISSAEVYGASLNGAGATDESALLQPVNPYAASKAAADLLVRQAAWTGLSTTVARPFNHTGPGQTEAFVAPSFAGQIARIEAGQAPPVIMVGSLDDERDFLDVDDVVSAYVAMIEARATCGRGDVFNVASGRSIRIGDILEHLLSLAKVSIDVEVDPSRLRAASIPRVLGDAGKLRNELGWKPVTALQQSLAAILEERRRAVAMPPTVG